MFRAVRQDCVWNISSYRRVVGKSVLGNPCSPLYSITPLGAKSCLLSTNPELNWDGEELRACLEFRLKDPMKLKQPRC